MAALLWSVLVLVCPSATIAVADDKANDGEKLQGLWAPTAIEVAGTKLPADAPPVKELRILIKGDKFIFNPDHKSQPKRELGFVLDPKQSPKTLDLIPQNGTAKGKMFPAGIYELKGDQLRLCLDEAQLESRQPGDRPRAFVTRKGDGLMVLSLKRVKP